MFRIALCDDEADQREMIRGLLEEYLAEQGLAAKIREFSAGQALLNAVMDEGFDIYLLDIVMPVMNGIDLGLALREADQNGTIIYLTTSPDFALESYQAEALSYLLKPARKEALYAVLEKAIKIQRKQREAGTTVKTHGGTVRLLLDQILYIELIGRTARYYLRDGAHLDSLTLPASFREAMLPVLEDSRFFLCGASYVINLYYVKMVSKAGVSFSNGRQLPIPKTVYRALNSAWADYWLEGGDKTC